MRITYSEILWWSEKKIILKQVLYLTFIFRLITTAAYFWIHLGLVSVYTMQEQSSRLWRTIHQVVECLGKNDHFFLSKSWKFECPLAHMNIPNQFFFLKAWIFKTPTFSTFKCLIPNMCKFGFVKVIWQWTLSILWSK